MDTDIFIVHVKREDIAEEVETRLDTSNCELDRPLLKRNNKKVIGSIKDELDGTIMKEFVGFGRKTYSFSKDNNDEDKKTKDTKKCVTKRKLKFQDYKNCLQAAQIEDKINYLEKYKINVDGLKENKK